MSKSITYKSSGVDIAKANRFVDSIQALTKSTQTSSVIKRAGSFGALYGLNLKGIKQPVLVSSTDGVGTKLLLANLLKKHDTIGVDLVAMNVNDILCTGAKPLFFLDYMACGKLDSKILKNVMKGIVEGCRQSSCALIGGETAEMPDMYHGKDYDLAGFCVGVVDKSKIIDGRKIKPGDVMIGLPSSGPHSNGYSLIRKALSTVQLKKYAKQVLAPTKIYVDTVAPLIEKFDVRGIAHITGGAFYDKLTKVLPNKMCFEVHRGSWPVPSIFDVIQKAGKVSDKNMYQTFNMGIGLVLVVDAKDSKRIQQAIKRRSQSGCFKIGKVIRHTTKKIVFN